VSCFDSGPDGRVTTDGVRVGTAIEARGLTRSFGTLRAVDGLDLPPSGLASMALPGRVPPLTASVRLSSGDGAEWSASVARVHYLGWLPANVLFIRIDALAADGRLLLRLADPRRVEVTR
jgi:hypothetical protein